MRQRLAVLCRSQLVAVLVPVDLPPLLLARHHLALAVQSRFAVVAMLVAQAAGQAYIRRAVVCPASVVLYISGLA